MSITDNCSLKFVDGIRDDVELAHGESVVLGRNAACNIRAVKCSRQQVKLTADLHSRSVAVCQLGANPSSINGKLLTRKSTTVLKEGDTLHIIEGLYPLTVHFSNAEPEKRKRKGTVQTDLVTKIAKVEIPDSEDVEFDEERMNVIKANLQLLKNVTESKVDVTSPITSQTESKKKATLVSDKKQVAFKDDWEVLDSLIVFTSAGVVHSAKIAAFDMDWTIICTKSGRVFPTSTSDWRIFYPEIKPKLKQLVQDGYKIVFMTNQMGIGKGKTKVSDFKVKIQNIACELKVPIQVLIAIKDGIYRKPAPGMWNHLLEKANDKVDVDVASSLFVGDAAGRDEKWAPGKKKDFAISDRLFALNLGLKFHTPEEFFLGWKPAPYKMPAFDPRQLPVNIPLCDPPSRSVVSTKQELLIMVGFPASGKSFFTEAYLLPKGYVSINRDTLKTQQKCLTVCDSSLRQGKSVVVDNTNPDKTSRAKYIELAIKHKVPCRCYVQNVNLQQAKHNNKFRQMTNVDQAHASVNDMILHTFKKNYQEPVLNEGFSEIVKINFIPKFQDDKSEKLYRMFLLDK